jgi:1-deoxy-D-xylulose-5-phosphate reductoisomerase
VSLGLAILGSTGSIGQSALKVAARHRERFRVVALTAFGRRDLLEEQVAAWRPAFVGLVSEAQNGWASGAACLVEAATRPDVDVVVNGVVGAAGLEATLAALRAGKRVALANKESLVMAGDLVTAAARAGGGTLVPVDSEHSAILQCLAGHTAADVARLTLTASGGPFHAWEAERVRAATVQEALQHPTWRMGRKITVDSATLANKALEVIEGHFLFGLPYDRINAVVHPQSIIHSFVEFRDGSVLAQLGFPNMELPILYALTWPERVADDGVTRYDPIAAGALTFEPVRMDVFGAIAEVIGAVLEAQTVVPAADLDTVRGADAWARRRAAEVLEG